MVSKWWLAYNYSHNTEQLVAVSVIWNGTTIDPNTPILMYHDEILLDHDTIPTVGNSNGPGDLVCRSENHEEARWHRPSGVTAPTSGDYRRVQSPAGSLPSLSRLSTIEDLTSTDPQYNGLWVCVLQNDTVINEQDLIDNFVYVGIYSRNSGEFDNLSTIILLLKDVF